MVWTTLVTLPDGPRGMESSLELASRSDKSPWEAHPGPALGLPGHLQTQESSDAPCSNPGQGDEAGGPEGLPGAGLEGRQGHRRPLRVLGALELGWRTQWCFRQEVTWQLGQML